MFAEALLAAVPQAEPEEGDYYEDGLLICGKCHTPRQMRLNAPQTALDGRVVQISCSCRKAAYEASEAQRKASEQRDRLADHIKAMIGVGIADPFPAHVFDRDDAPERKAAQMVRRYADKFPAMLQNNIGLMLYGPAGTGKTFLAGCVANALNAAGWHVCYTSIGKLTAAANRNFGEMADDVQDEVQKCSLLVLDDFGVERDTEYSWEQTERIINWRYESGRPLLATTNLSPQAMRSDNITKQRVFDRVLEMCQTLRVDGESRRRLNAAKKAQIAKELLGGD